jgi:1,4-dihydroxy-2-naphthoate octaprenyltransferase
VVCYIIGTAIVFPMLITHVNSQLITVFSCGIVLAFFYTATPVGLKYHALRDVTIFLCFGPLLMQCTSLMISGEMRSCTQRRCARVVVLGFSTGESV